ncbi:MAG: ester cyclase [Pseudomonadota bacterium]
MSNLETARAFFDACETGKGWEVCAQYCQTDAGFAAQSGALADISMLSAYCDWMKGLLVPLPDGRYELTGFAEDADRDTVVASAVFRGTHTVDAGTGAPTGKSAASDYVYVMKFDGGKVSHMTKVWNDSHALQQLGWA